MSGGHVKTCVRQTLYNEKMNLCQEGTVKGFKLNYQYIYEFFLNELEKCVSVGLNPIPKPHKLA